MLSSKRFILSLALRLLALSNRCVQGASKKVESGFLNIKEAPDEAAVARADTSLMGKMFPILSEIFGRKNGLSFQQVTRAVSELADRREIAVLAAVGWGIVPLTRIAYEAYVNVTERGMAVDDGAAEVDENSEKSASSKSKRIWEVYEGITPWDDTRMHEIYERVTHWDDDEVNRTGPDRNIPTSSEISKRGKRSMVPFKESILYLVVNHISQASKIGLSVIVVDCVTFFARMMGYSADIMKHVPRIYSKVAYTGWVTQRLQAMKRYFLEKTMVKSYGGDLGKLQVVNDLVDGLLYLGWTFHLLNYLEVQTGVAVKSLFSIGATER